MLRTCQASRTDRLVAVCAHRGVSLAALLVLATLPPPRRRP